MGERVIISLLGVQRQSYWFLRKALKTSGMGEMAHQMKEEHRIRYKNRSKAGT